MYNTILLLFLVLFIFQQGRAQHLEEHSKNIGSVSFGFTKIPSGSDLNNNSEGIFIPSIGVDYLRMMNSKFGLGVMIDFELDHYLISKKELERDHAIIGVIGGGYHITTNLLTFTGFGVEVEENKDIFIYRLGIEYSIEITKEWSIGPSFYFDWKEGYDTYDIAIGFSRKF